MFLELHLNPGMATLDAPSTMSSSRTLATPSNTSVIPTFRLFGILSKKERVLLAEPSLDDTIANLQACLKANNPNLLGGYDASALTLWKLDDPIHCDDLDSFFPLDSESLPTIAEKMNPVKQLVRYFQVDPIKDHIQFVVELPAENVGEIKLVPIFRLIADYDISTTLYDLQKINMVRKRMRLLVAWFTEHAFSELPYQYLRYRCQFLYNLLTSVYPKPTSFKINDKITDIAPKRPRRSKDNSPTFRSLGTDALHSADILAYTLWSTLWKRPHDLEKYTTYTKKHIPSVVDLTLGVDQSGTSYERNLEEEYKIIDIRPLMPPEDPYALEFPICYHFLIRQEYEELDFLLSRQTQYRFLLTGQPGVGKTVYLTYSLLHRLIKGLPTLYAANGGSWFLFTNAGAYWVKPSQSSDLILYSGVPPPGPGGLMLFDLNSTQTSVENAAFLNFKVLVSSSPKPDSYQRWVKEKMAETFVIKSWTWKEVYQAHTTQMEQILTLEDLSTRFIKYGGGSARVIFCLDIEQIECYIAQAIQQCVDAESWQTLFRNPDMHRGGIGHALVMINPVEAEGIINRRRITTRIASKYIYEKMTEAAGKVLVNSFGMHFNFLFKNDEARSASSILFEGAGHPFMYKSRSQPIPILSLSGHSDSVLKLNHITAINHFDPADIDKFDKLNASRYYKPNTHILPGIDSFFLEVDDNRTVINPVFFQFTTSLSHTTSPKFLETMWVKSPKWKLVFVVPKALVPNFKEQSWEPAKAQMLWSKRVDQYVLGVDTSQLWANNGTE